MKAGRKGLSQADQERIWAVREGGLNDSQVARKLGLESRRVTRFLAGCGGIRPPARTRSAQCLTLVEREEISRGIARGDSARLIAMGLGRSHTTVLREIDRSGGKYCYRAVFADEEAWVRARRPKQTKLDRCPELREIVESALRDDQSPEQISGWLARQYPDTPRMRLAPETIYRALYVQSRGTLKRELTAHLRTGRTKRQARGSSRHGQGRGQIKDKVMISQRPPEVEDRAVPGHWEGDLLMGNKTTAIATLVERQTRYTQLVALPDGFRAEPVRAALAESIATLPEQLLGSLTWDQGKEMAEHKQFTIDSGLQVYFCDPRSPWQRGSNENTNGLLRQYFPKGQTLKAITQAELDQVAAQLNRRPRKTLGFMTPAEKLRELIDGAPTAPVPDR
jgi:IS30 family transposase